MVFAIHFGNRRSASRVAVSLLVMIAGASHAAQIAFSDAATPHVIESETAQVNPTEALTLSMLGEGWRTPWRNLLTGDFLDSSDHRDAIWATSAVTTIHARVVTPRDRTMRLSMAQYATALQKLPPQRVDVAWNGTIIGRCIFSAEIAGEMRPFTFLVPKDLQHEGLNRITFYSHYSVSPAELGVPGSTDQRAFALKSLALAPVTHPNAETASEALRFGEGALVLAPHTRVRFPVRMPVEGDARFGLAAGPAAELGARAFLRWDSVDGPVEQAIDVTAVQTSALDLAEHRGKVIEFVFENTGESETRWLSPHLDTSAADAPVADAATFKTPQAQNVIFVLLDALRADALGSYGYARETSPTLDAMANAGIRVDRVYATAPYTYSSTWSLLTALYPHQHKAYINPWRPDASMPTLPRVLRDAGITTGLVTANPWFDDSRFGEDFDVYQGAFETFAGVGLPERDAAMVTDAGISFLKGHATQRFFLYLHYMHPHEPYHAPAPSANLFTVDPDPTPITPNADDIYKVIFGERGATREEIVQLRARYDELLRNVDAEMARLLAALHEAGLAENTIIVVSSDHGEAFNEHGLLSHNLHLYEEFSRIPMIIYGRPLGTEVRGVIDGVHSNVDFFPTICALLGVEVPAGLAGSNVLDAGSNAVDDIHAFARATFNRNPLEAYWWGRYKLIRDDFNPFVEVYDLARDPGERTDLAPVYPVLTNWLLSRALDWRNTTESLGAPPRDDITIDPGRREELESLGYLFK